MYPSGNRAIGSIWKGEGKPWNLVCCMFKQTLRQICDQQQEQEPDVHLSLKLFYCLDSFSSSGFLKAGMVVEAVWLWLWSLWSIPLLELSVVLKSLRPDSLLCSFIF